MAWAFYESSGSGEGCQAVLGLLVARSGAYARADEYDLHCRIVAGTRAYRDVWALFDALYASDRFEMLLSRADRGGDAARQAAYQAALVRYLKERHPADAATLSLVCLRFGLFTDLGRRLEEGALDKLRVYAEARKPAAQSALRSPERAAALLGHALQPPLAEHEGLCAVSAAGAAAMAAGGASGARTPADRILDAFYRTPPARWHDFFARCTAADRALFLTVCMQELLQAADHYATTSSLACAARCFHHAALVALQRRAPRTPLLFLAPRAAVDALLACPRVADALTLARVYRLRRDLSRAVYAQVVARGNMPYADELRRAVPVAPALWYEVAKLYELDVLAPQQQQQQSSSSSSSSSSQQQRDVGGVAASESQQRLAALTARALPSAFAVANAATKTRNMRALLLRLDDRFVMYDIAVKLRFADIAAQLRQNVPGLRHFCK